MTVPRGRPSPRAASSHVETWVFDLDNTLYPHHLNLWQQVDERIRAYIAGFLDVTHEEAFRLQKDYYQRYGTSMRGPDDRARDAARTTSSTSSIRSTTRRSSPIRRSARRWSKLPGRKLILTNGTRKHADAVMQRLAIHRHFEDVFDIIAAELEPKPPPQTYDRFLARHGVDPAKAAMFEDLARNLEVPHALGMTTVLVVPGRHAGGVPRETGSWKAAMRPIVDHVTDDLVACPARDRRLGACRF